MAARPQPLAAAGDGVGVVARRERARAPRELDRHDARDQAARLGRAAARHAAGAAALPEDHRVNGDARRDEQVEPQAAALSPVASPDGSPTSSAPPWQQRRPPSRIFLSHSSIVVVSCCRASLITLLCVHSCFKMVPDPPLRSYVSRPIFTGSRRVFVGIAPFSLSCARLYCRRRRYLDVVAREDRRGWRRRRRPELLDVRAIATWRGPVLEVSAVTGASFTPSSLVPGSRQP